MCTSFEASDDALMAGRHSATPAEMVSGTFLPSNVKEIASTASRICSATAVAPSISVAGRTTRNSSPVACDDVGRPDLGRKRVGNLNEREIAGSMPVIVVDPFEMVDIEQDDTRRFRRSVGESQALVQALEPESAVVKLSEWVVRSLLVEQHVLGRLDDLQREDLAEL